MAAALSVRTATGTVIVAKTVCHIEVTGGTTNETSGAERRYYILGDAPGATDDLRSHVFGVNHDGKHTWDDVIFPVAGAWTLRLRNVATDADEATQAVTVAAA